MIRNLSIKLKALFLLIVFASNTAVGFVCALGMDMGFNAPNQSEIVEAVEVHVHDDSKKHVHEKEVSESNNHVHEDGAKHQHDSEPSKQIPVDDGQSFTKSPGGCCSNEVQKFQNLDKNVTVNTGIDIPVFVAILNIFSGIDLSNRIKDLPTKYKARFYYPPSNDIRIAMQRFQI